MTNPSIASDALMAHNLANALQERFDKCMHIQDEIYGNEEKCGGKVLESCWDHLWIMEKLIDGLFEIEIVDSVAEGWSNTIDEFRKWNMANAA